MHRFHKVKAKHIYNSDTGVRTNLKHLFSLIENKEDFSIVYRPTGEDIKDQVIKIYLSRKKNSTLSANVDKGKYGPDKPLSETKFYRCQNCDCITKNRFKCTKCWEKVQDMDEGDFIYHVI